MLQVQYTITIHTINNSNYKPPPTKKSLARLAVAAKRQEKAVTSQAAFSGGNGSVGKASYTPSTFLVEHDRKVNTTDRQLPSNCLSIYNRSKLRFAHFTNAEHINGFKIITLLF